MVCIKIFVNLIFVNAIFFFFVLLCFFCLCIPRLILFFFFVKHTMQDILLFVYEEEDFSDDISERFLQAYDMYVGFLFEWEREYYAYYLEDQEEEVDGKEADDFEFTEAAFIMYLWYFKLLYQWNYLNEKNAKGLNSIKDMQTFVLVKKYRDLRKKRK